MEGYADMLKKFRKLGINGDIIGLLESKNDSAYFCSPLGAEVIGWTGVDGIHYCFIPSLDKDMVFAVSPIPCGKNYVEPVSNNFLDFLSIIVCCGNSSPLEQISWLSEADFINLIEEDYKNFVDGTAEVLDKIKSTFAIDTSIEPYNYVKSIQDSFDYSSIPYSDEYYDLTGLDRP